MGKLVYSAMASLDGYIEDAQGKFGWAEPDEELHTFVNDLEREIATYLYGRRMYNTMVYWETVDTTGHPSYVEDYARIWRAADKIVYSRTLESPSSERTRIAGEFDADGVRRLKQSDERDLSIGGAELAGEAIRAGLVDELQLTLTPIIVGGGKRALPDDVTVALELISERRFANGVVHLHYRLN
jgi:dihydrofolate reductase